MDFRHNGGLHARVRLLPFSVLTEKQVFYDQRGDQQKYKTKEMVVSMGDIYPFVKIAADYGRCVALDHPLHQTAQRVPFEPDDMVIVVVL